MFVGRGSVFKKFFQIVRYEFLLNTDPVRLSEVFFQNRARMVIFSRFFLYLFEFEACIVFGNGIDRFFLFSNAMFSVKFLYGDDFFFLELRLKKGVHKLYSIQW